MLVQILQDDDHATLKDVTVTGISKPRDLRCPYQNPACLSLFLEVQTVLFKKKKKISVSMIPSLL